MDIGININSHSDGDICSIYLMMYMHACINKQASKNQDKKKEWWKKKTLRHNSLAEGQGWGVSSIYNKNSECSLKSPTLLNIEVAFVLKASSMCKCQSIPWGKLDLFSLQSFSLSPISFPKSFFFVGLWAYSETPSFIHPRWKPFLLLKCQPFCWRIFPVNFFQVFWSRIWYDRSVFKCPGPWRVIQCSFSASPHFPPQHLWAEFVIKSRCQG